MVQYIKNANLWGRIGTNLGKGLAEQLPAAVDQGRLAAGLRQFEQDAGGLTPLQQGARIAAIPGITPQAQQTLGELARFQNQGNAYRKSADGQGVQPGPSPRDVQFGNFQQQQGQTRQPGMSGQNMPPIGQVNNRQQSPNQNANENIPQVAEGNVLNEQALTRLPWTPQQRNQAIADYMDKGFLPDQAKQLQVDDEARDLGEPAAHKQRQADIKAAKAEVSSALNRHLEKKLQKTGDDQYKDVEGKMMLNAERGMIRDLIQNPKADIDNVANDWSERLYQTAIAKGDLKRLGTTTGIENFWKGAETEKRLKEYQNIFKRSGNLEEFQNILKGPEFGMSDQGSAFVAYPPSEKVNKFLKSYKPSILNTSKKYQEATKLAMDLEDLIGPDDSIQSIMRAVSAKDPFFDQQSFLDQLSEDKDRIGLNERQRRELGQGKKNLIPNWADMLYLPNF